MNGVWTARVARVGGPRTKCSGGSGPAAPPATPDPAASVSARATNRKLAAYERLLSVGEKIL